MDKEDVVQAFLDIMNEALELDASAISNLCNRRAVCNTALADHSTIQVAEDPINATHQVGLLGILNGICERLTGERIAAEYPEGDDNENIVKFVPWKPWTS